MHGHSFLNPVLSHVRRLLLIITLITTMAPSAVSEDDPPPPETVLITGCEFTMGTPLRWRDREYHADETPVRVVVDTFRIGKFPVTAAEVCAFLNSELAKAHDPESLYNHRDIGLYSYSTIMLSEDGRFTPREDAANAPANQVTWKGAVLYCQWLSEATGERYRLPTEAEWELTARGKELRKWPWGNESPTNKHGERFDDGVIPMNTTELADRIRRGEPTWTTSPVGSYPANATPEGVHDMFAYIIGEWVVNKYVERPTPEQMVDTSADLDDLTLPRVVRGYYHRYYSRGLTGLIFPFAETPKHGGRTWTRMHVHPMDAPKQAARHGFRVVQEVGVKH